MEIRGIIVATARPLPASVAAYAYTNPPPGVVTSLHRRQLARPRLVAVSRPQVGSRPSSKPALLSPSPSPPVLADCAVAVSSSPDPCIASWNPLAHASMPPRQDPARVEEVELECDSIRDSNVDGCEDVAYRMERRTRHASHFDCVAQCDDSDGRRSGYGSSMLYLRLTRKPVDGTGIGVLGSTARHR